MDILKCEYANAYHRVYRSTEPGLRFVAICWIHRGNEHSLGLGGLPTGSVQIGGRRSMVHLNRQRRPRQLGWSSGSGRITRFSRACLPPLQTARAEPWRGEVRGGSRGGQHMVCRFVPVARPLDLFLWSPPYMSFSLSSCDSDDNQSQRG